MPLKKYVEIEWKEVRLKPFKDWGETRFFLNIASDYPTIYVPKNINEKLISNLEQEQLADNSWVIRPKRYIDRIIFSGYVETLLQVAINVLESDDQSIANFFANSSEKIADLSKSTSGVLGKFFPFLGISNLVFSGIASLLRDRDDFLGSFVYQLRRDTHFPIGQSIVGSIYKGSECVGEVDLNIYIQPEEAESALFYYDVEIFPFSADEIAVYYSGCLSNSEQLYMIWTLDNWKSNPLNKMKKMGRYWVYVIKIPSHVESEAQLEIAFTDDNENWDNNEGSNWIFRNFRWF